ncbi:MAG: glycosyltransferase [Planctomycetota bacterium]|nr:MAG: glycosyltransferase [Planctomycetota bacterium]
MLFPTSIRGPAMRVSIIVPMFNEVESALLVVQEIVAVMDGLPGPSELILVDDGSTDGTARLLDQLAANDSRLVVVHFRRNFGQTAALQAGLEIASGEAIVLLDGDGQNDPRDIPRLLDRLAEGYDLVHGWRRQRQDKWLTRKLPSRVANWLISRVTRFPIHDLGCTLKVMRREIAEELELYGEMHRFIPILAHWRGARCVEMETHHRERRFGESKYGLSRTVRVLLDLLTVKYMLDHFSSPMRWFGGAGLGFVLAGTSMLMVSLMMKAGYGVDMTDNPLLLIGAFMCLISIQLFSIGLLGEVNTRMYYQRDGKRPFAIRRVVGQCFDTERHKAGTYVPKEPVRQAA